MWFRFAPDQVRAVSPTLDAGEVAKVFLGSGARFLGAGTYGESWVITSASSSSVAKVMLDSPVTSRLLAREIEGLRRVSSPHVVRLDGASLVSLSSGQRFALSFEYIDGGDVMANLRRGNWPSEAECLSFVTGALRGLVALHAAEVAHRDVKPENIALRAGAWSSPVILDLGLGRLLDRSTQTAYPQAVGTATYMAPEVIEGRPARKGSDLWSLGVVGYLLLTRRHPFLPDPDEVLDEDEMLERIAAGAPTLPSSVGNSLGAVITRMLSRKSHERGSAARALADLERA